MPTKPKYIVTDASIYTVRPVVTEYHVRSVERSTPPICKFLNFVSGLLAFLPTFVLVGWLLGIPGAPIESASQARDRVIDCLIVFAAAIAVKMISNALAGRGR